MLTIFFGIISSYLLLVDYFSMNEVFINAGKPAYISVQTFLEHALYIKYSLHPDFVIHFDGSNDSVGHPKFWPRERYPGVRDNIHRYTEDGVDRAKDINWRWICNKEKELCPAAD